ncbi:MAG TPA: hypothetical protein VKX17_12310 [Planctomycetota bacterium]|nr:hypothetical protein [Planctomycetota bacterium]
MEISNARFVPCMDSFLGAWAGVLRALDDERPIEDLWGLSALGLRTQIHRALQPVGLLGRQWDETCAAIVMRTGYACAAGLRDHFYTPDDLRQLRLAWMRTIEKALDDGRPAISFGLHGPAFGIVYGFDDQTENYFVSTFLDAESPADERAATASDPHSPPINAMDLGSENPPLIFVLIPTGPLADYDSHAAARAALKEAIDHHLGQERDKAGKLLETPADLASGPAAYNAWSAAIETARIAQPWCLGYYAAYYAEARSGASAWLKKLRSDPAFAAAQKSFVQAAAHLDHETECFGNLSQLFPMNQPDALRDQGRRTDASACLRMARAEHVAALEALIEGDRALDAEK